MTLVPTPGLTWMQRFSSEKYSISSISYECGHGKHYEVEVHNKECGHRKTIHHCHNYREHWRAMFDSSEHLIVSPEFFGDDSYPIV
jgi:hypothetical protein